MAGGRWKRGERQRWRRGAGGGEAANELEISGNFSSKREIEREMGEVVMEETWWTLEEKTESSFISSRAGINVIGPLQKCQSGAQVECIPAIELTRVVWLVISAG